MKTGLLALVMVAGPGIAEAQGPAYDVVSIKPNKTGSGSIGVDIDNGQFNGTNITLKMMIQRAWHLPTGDLIYGLPAWANDAHYDMRARVDAETVAALKKMSREDREVADERMMQDVLTERFQLKVHPETKELPVYQLVVAKGGVKMKKTVDDSGGRGMHTNSQKLTATDDPMPDFARYLSERLHRKVEDQTGLSGHYDFTLQWSPDDLATDKAPEFPTLMTAIEEQLGLKLVGAKGPVDTIVVDKVEQPTEN